MPVLSHVLWGFFECIIFLTTITSSEKVPTTITSSEEVSEAGHTPVQHEATVSTSSIFGLSFDTQCQCSPAVDVLRRWIPEPDVLRRWIPEPAATTIFLRDLMAISKSSYGLLRNCETRNVAGPRPYFEVLVGGLQGNCETLGSGLTVPMQGREDQQGSSGIACASPHVSRQSAPLYPTECRSHLPQARGLEEA